MAQTDYYKILGVERNASASTIKNAYRRLAMKYHPDKHKGDKESETKFKEINEAYTVLNDQEKKNAYDNYGHAGVNGGGGNSGGGFSSEDLGDIFGNFRDIFGGGGDAFSGAFGDVFGGGQQSRRGADMQYKLSISFMEAFNGCKKEFTIPVAEACDKCNGNGAKDGTALKDCLRCGGTGTMVSSRGFLQVQQPCSSCHGRGKIIEEACPSCNGKGAKSKNKNISLNIPAGINDSDKMVIRGEATAGNLQPGDVYVWINIKAHPLFHREGPDLLCEMPIDIFDAILGCSIELPAPRHKVAVKIPAGTQNGKILRLRGEGMPRLNSKSSGDIMVQIKVETPVNLNTQQKEMIQELKDDVSKDKINHSPNTSSWKDKLKSLFK